MKVFNLSLPWNDEYGVIGLRTLYFIYKRVPLMKKVAKFDFKEVYVLDLRPRPNVELFIHETNQTLI